MAYKEENFENAVIQTLVGEGWNWIPPELQPVREDYRNPLLREKLATIARLPVNRGLKAQAIAEAIKRIDNVEGTALLSRNRTFTDYLQNGVEVSWVDEEVEVYDDEARVEVRRKASEVQVARVRLIDTLRKNRTIDWQRRDAARAKMRLMVKKLLKKYKYPPNEAQEAMEIVLRQCEFWTDNAPEEEIPYDEYKRESESGIIRMIKAHEGGLG